MTPVARITESAYRHAASFRRTSIRLLRAEKPSTVCPGTILMPCLRISLWIKQAMSASKMFISLGKLQQGHVNYVQHDREKPLDFVRA